MTTTAAPGTPTRVAGEMSFLDRFLPVWIIAAMILGLALGRFVPGLNQILESMSVAGISVPIAIGLLVMMYPVLAKVRYDETRRVTADRKLMVLSLVLNWIVGPAIMFTLAWLLLADLPEYRTGLIIVGLARCIAMVFIWNDLACGDREAAAVLVAINSVFQVLAFGALGWFYLQVLPSWLGLPVTSAEFSVGAIVLSVLVFLGIPLLAGFLTRVLGERAKGRYWYENRFLPRIGPFAMYGLLFTIVLLFALQGEAITSNPWDVARIALPLLAYFVGMFLISLVAARAVGLTYAKSTTVAFTASGNNFELAIAVAIGTFGVTSGQALAGVVGPLIEVPVLVALVYVSLWLGPRLFPGDTTVPARTTREGLRMSSQNSAAPSVLFVCVKNGGKSQMAAALLRHHAGDAVEVHSAGTKPGSAINALSADVVAEVGADMSAGFTKPIDPALLARVDRVVVLGEEAVVEPVPGMAGTITTWVTDEPSERGIEGAERMRLVRDDIDARVRTLLDDLTQTST